MQSGRFVSVPWRGCVASAVFEALNPDPKPFRPLAGMCCVICKVLGISVPVHFPSPGGDVLRLASIKGVPRKEFFPSPGGDVLRRIPACRIRLPARFPSPGGDVLRRRARHYAAIAQQAFRPLAGMCCVHRLWSVHIRTPLSVPWRGCVASQQAHSATFCADFPSPGGDVLRLVRGLSDAALHLFPSPGGDVLRHMKTSTVAGVGVFPSPGGDVLRPDEHAEYHTVDGFPSPGGDVLRR